MFYRYCKLCGVEVIKYLCEACGYVYYEKNKEGATGFSEYPVKLNGLVKCLNCSSCEKLTYSRSLKQPHATASVGKKPLTLNIGGAKNA